MPSGHILVADDDAGILHTVLNQALTRAGYEVPRDRNGCRALALGGGGRGRSSS